ncbi:hypothetical protein PCURB6_28320 [Paenibacillus curdlanolyticus]|nr:hypothetical protein PCURB6_28320 [Paenibacillus curdlanolyticus]
MRKRNIFIAAAIVTVYIFCPAFRYYAIGSYIGYKILFDKPIKTVQKKPKHELIG